MDTKVTPRIPEEVNGLQYNHCKNPRCKNYGLPASQQKIYGNNTYTVAAGGKGHIPLLKCSCCGEMPPMKSNQGIVEEIERLSSYLNQSPCCSNPECSNHTVPVGTKKAYASFGTTASGGKRYRCNVCKKTLTISKPTYRQLDTHHNIEIFKLLVNKVPLNRIINIVGISWEVLYHRMNFIHKQCMAFIANRENKLKDMPIKRLYLAIDRQDYEVNWTERKDKRNVVLSAIASADNSTGYVFGIHPNFDHRLNKEEIELDAQMVEDHLKKPPFKKYARLWLESDYKFAHKQSSTYKKSTELIKNISQTYDELTRREDIEAVVKRDTEKLPDYGIQVRAEYTMIAHFYFLRQLLGNVEKWRFFLDQESGIRSACLTAFQKEVAEHTAEAFYVAIEKELTVDEKREFKAKAKKAFDEFKEKFPLLSDNEIKIEMLKNEIQSVLHLGDFKDSWVKHPFPSMAEPNKAMCWLTEHEEGDMDLTHKAWLYNKASLHGVDVFFQKIRRRMSMFERPIHSSGNAGRTWNGYGCYNPSHAVKMLEIFRVVHNYIDTKKEDGVVTTPAMRLGLANAPLDYKDILYYE